MVLYVKRSGDTITYRTGWIYLNYQPLVCLIDSKFLRLLSCIRVLSRLLRLEPRCATLLSEDLLLVAFRNQVLVVGLSKKKVIDYLPTRPSFSTPLTFCSMKLYGEEVVYWGDYGENANSEEINIYKYSELGLEVCYTFPAQHIKHIHNILYDKWHDRFVVLTGDLGNKVGIYLASRDFTTVTPFLVGKEQYRAVQGFVTETGLVWATDAVMSDNHLYYCSFANMEVVEIAPLNGSVIYGLSVNGGLLYSTTVEPYPTGKSLIKMMINNRLGPGIKSRDVYLGFCSQDLKVSTFKVFKKDWLPMCLFQYGQIMFPEYENEDVVEVLINPMSVKKYDGKTLRIKL